MYSKQSAEKSIPT